MNTANGDLFTTRGLLPYSIILAATKGDTGAMGIVLQHYRSHITILSMQKAKDS